MGHGDHSRPGSPWVVTTVDAFDVDHQTASNVIVPVAHDFAHWDELQSGAVTLDGGFFNPVKPIYIGGAGFKFNAQGGCDGGVKTRRGGRLRHGTGNDYTTLNPSRDRAIAMDLLTARSPNLNDEGSAGDDLATSLSPAGLRTLKASTQADIAIRRRFLHNGATLNLLELRFRVLTPPSSVSGSPITILGGRFAPNVGGSLPTFGNFLSSFSTWSAGHSYALNSYVAPTSPHANGLYYFSAGGGTSGGSEPTWPTHIGGTVVDGGVTWTRVGFTGQLAPPATVRAYYNGGLSQSLFLTPNQDNVIDLASYRYLVQIIPAHASILLERLTLSLSGIADLRPG